MAVFTSDPVLYRELTSNAHSSFPTEPSEEEVEPPVDSLGDDDDLDPTVEEVCALILSAQNAEDTTQPVNAADKLDDEEDEDINPAPPPAFVPTSTSTRSGRTTRPPTRYPGSHWVAY
ncbi:hypothetical protein RhiLY_08821 [Ceratobasidium sp. AG-Ba]|nr:hypothetical protein RhiLY_08821 [Ceratobasidium sp. AG-Ba]